ncbi:N-acetylmuramoyl-L-alanine amidase family protein [Kallotenue papyrolyticum]|uniref:N-acetylmuramoyl-L-alanine amidase family protein n=1 Tax=Kallotenue papyrolyticum TaxID=1325125 RepID=UPI0004927A64|nr:N-acetylmuramoyl-L-alanine amidase [Kallotenue papyrolyticum]
MLMRIRPWQRIVLLLLLPALLGLAPAALAQPQPLRGVTIVIDPGHGGNDFGVDPAGSGLQEKAVVLEIGQRLARLAAAEGATVALTRTSDRYVSLAARVRYANALLFRPDNAADQGRLISVHVNSNRKNPTLRRVEVLVDPHAAGPFTFAADLAARLRAATGGTVGYRDAGYPDGVHPADVAPVRWTFPRGHNVLTESAFLSNPEQARLLHDASFLEAIARAHLEALRAELGR